MAGRYTLQDILINTGSGPNDGSGDSIRDAFIKVNEGFQTLWCGGPSGPTGPSGPSGPSGPQGNMGVQGNQGIIGHQGPTGVQGGAGPQGYTGAQGCMGAQGYQGVPGARGTSGCSGNHGAQGSQGAQGYQGLTGGQGVAGPIGGSTGNIIYNNSGVAGGFGCWNGSTMRVPGNFVATGNVTAYCSSDVKFKENVQDIPGALDKVNAIGGKLFDWTSDYLSAQGMEDGYFVQKNDFGVIAQDVNLSLIHI